MKSGDHQFYETPKPEGVPADRIRETIKRCSIGGVPPAAIMLERTDIETILAERDELIAALEEVLNTSREVAARTATMPHLNARARAVVALKKARGGT